MTFVVAAIFLITIISTARAFTTSSIVTSSHYNGQHLCFKRRSPLRQLKSTIVASTSSQGVLDTGAGTGTSQQHLNLVEYSGNGASRVMHIDEERNTFKPSHAKTYDTPSLLTSLKHHLITSFIPSGVMTEDYYTYTAWRIAQRFVSATTNVFCTQALFLALGFKKNRIGVAAATTWVLKDALGKVSRIVWASKYGRKFDSDAKKWRFLSSLLFAAGNAFEIVTYIFPSMFLVFAAIANASKQIAMLTSSATRNTIYKSFARNSDNIGDITAKGEAQIAVIDLLGMLAGIMVSRVIDTSRTRIAIAFVLLSIFDLICIFNEIRSLVFNHLNFDRAGIVLKRYFTYNQASTSTITTGGSDDRMNNTGGSNNKGTMGTSSVTTNQIHKVLTPSATAMKEHIFIPTRQGEALFQLWSTVKIKAKELSTFLAVNEPSPECRFIFYAHARLVKSRFDILSHKVGLDSVSVLRSFNGIPVLVTPQVLLRKDATAFDVFRAIVVTHRFLHYIEQKSHIVSKDHTAAAYLKHNNYHGRTQDESNDEAVLKSLGLDISSLTETAKAALDYEKSNMRDIVNDLRSAGWDMNKFMFGVVKRRVEWDSTTKEEGEDLFSGVL